MKVGMLLPQVGENTTRENILYVEKEVEKEGFDSVWVLERLLWPLKPQTPYGTHDGSLDFLSCLYLSTAASISCLV
jgi:hypothetical protein